MSTMSSTSSHHRNSLKLEKRRLERLKKELDRQQKKLNEEKIKFQQQIQELRSEQNKIATYKHTESKLKTELEKAKKEKREIRKLYEEAQSEIKLLRRKVKRGSRHSSLCSNTSVDNNDDALSHASLSPHHHHSSPESLHHHVHSAHSHSHHHPHSPHKHWRNNQYSFHYGSSQQSICDDHNNRIRRHAKKEVSNMKKRLRLAMNDLDKQARYYETQIKNIKKQKKKEVSIKEKQLMKELQRRKSSFHAHAAHAHSSKHHRTHLPLKDSVSSGSTQSRSSCFGAYCCIASSPRSPHKNCRTSTSHHTLLKSPKSPNLNAMESPRRLKKDDSAASKGRDSQYLQQQYYETEDEEDSGSQFGSSSVYSLNADEIFHEFVHELGAICKDIKKLYAENITEHEDLVKLVKLRHTKLMSRLNELQFDMNLYDEMQEMMANYEAKIESVYNDVLSGYKQKTFYMNTSQQTLEYVQKTLAVLQNQQPKALLDEIIAILIEKKNRGEQDDDDEEEENESDIAFLAEWIEVFTAFRIIYNEKRAHHDLLKSRMNMNRVNMHKYARNKTRNHSTFVEYNADTPNLTNFELYDASSSDSMENDIDSNDSEENASSNLDGLDDELNENAFTISPTIGSITDTTMHSSVYSSNLSSCQLSTNISMELLDELSQRRKDIEAIQMLYDNKMEIPREEIENIRQSTKKRHSLTMNKLLHLIQSDVLLLQRTDCPASPDAAPALLANNFNVILGKLRSDNAEWQKELEKLSMESEEIKFIKQLNKQYNDELNARIADLLKLYHLVSNNSKFDNETLKKEMSTIVQSIFERHRNRIDPDGGILYDEHNVPHLPSSHSSMTRDSSFQSESTTNTEKVANFICEYETKEINENNQDWRDVVVKFVRMVSNEEDFEFDGNHALQCAGNNLSTRYLMPLTEGDCTDHGTDCEHDEDEHNEHDVWWLYKNQQRKRRFQSLLLDEQQKTELIQIGVYIDRMLSRTENANDTNKFSQMEDDEDSKMSLIDDVSEEDGDEETTDSVLINSLYFPLPSKLHNDAYAVLLALSDGVILCRLLNVVQCMQHIDRNEDDDDDQDDKDYIDLRSVEYPDLFQPRPISDQDMFDNFQLLLSFAKVLNIRLDTYKAGDVLNENLCKLPQLVIDFVNGIASLNLSQRINMCKYHELVRLVKNNEDMAVIRTMSGQQWLQRWINYINGNRVLREITNDQFNIELANAMKLNTNTNTDTDNGSVYEEPLIVEQLIQFASNTANITTADLLSHNRLLQDLFAVNLYELKSGCWNTLSKDEQISYKQQIRLAANTENNMNIYIQWINGILSEHYTRCSSSPITQITSIRDLYSGCILLKLLDLAKPGCVEWNSVRSHSQIRHKFDRVTNGNMVIKICSYEFGFSLVGYAGSDIADGNQQTLQSLLLQLMRFYSTCKLSKLMALPLKQTVSDCDILQWANLTINECEYSKSKSLQSFQDASLSSCIFYCELLKAVRPKHIDLSCVYYDTSPNAHACGKKYQICNARYVISMIRRLGGEIFVTPSTLCSVEYKAVLSVFAAIMTIAMSDQQHITHYNDHMYLE